MLEPIKDAYPFRVKTKYLREFLICVFKTDSMDGNKVDEIITHGEDTTVIVSRNKYDYPFVINELYKMEYFITINHDSERRMNEWCEMIEVRSGRGSYRSIILNMNSKGIEL